MSFGKIYDGVDVKLEYKNSNEEVIWIGKQKSTEAPVCFKKNCFGKYPLKDIWVSQRHRIIYKNEQSKKNKQRKKNEQNEEDKKGEKIFICARELTRIGNPGIFIDTSIKNIVYYHIETKNHNIIDISGIKSETLDSGLDNKIRNNFN